MRRQAQSVGAPDFSHVPVSGTLEILGCNRKVTRSLLGSGEDVH